MEPRGPGSGKLRGAGPGPAVSLATARGASQSGSAAARADCCGGARRCGAPPAPPPATANSGTVSKRARTATAGNNEGGAPFEATGHSRASGGGLGRATMSWLVVTCKTLHGTAAQDQPVGVCCTCFHRGKASVEPATAASATAASAAGAIGGRQLTNFLKDSGTGSPASELDNFTGATSAGDVGTGEGRRKLTTANAMQTHKPSTTPNATANDTPAVLKTAPPPESSLGAGSSVPKMASSEDAYVVEVRVEGSSIEPVAGTPVCISEKYATPAVSVAV